jgi:pilus assembly protein Flp/PilA
MSTFSRAVIAFLQDESGPTAVEYAVQMALIIAVCIHIVQVLSSDANRTFNTVATAVNTSGS